MPAFSRAHYERLEGKEEPVTPEQREFNKKADLVLLLIFSPFLLGIFGMLAVGGLLFLKGVFMFIIDLGFVLFGANPPF